MEMYGHQIAASGIRGQNMYQQGMLGVQQAELPSKIAMQSATADMYRQHVDLYRQGGAGAVQSQMLTPALRSQAVKNASMYMLRQGITDVNSDQYKTAYPLALEQAQRDLMAQNPVAQGAAAPGPNAYLNFIQ